MRENRNCAKRRRSARKTKDVVDYMFKATLDPLPAPVHVLQLWLPVAQLRCRILSQSSPTNAILKATVLDPAGLDVRKWPTSCCGHTPPTCDAGVCVRGIEARCQPSLAHNLVANVFRWRWMVKRQHLGRGVDVLGVDVVSLLVAPMESENSRCVGYPLLCAMFRPLSLSHC